MGIGIDLGNPDLTSEQRQGLENFRDQMLIVLLNRLKDKDGTLIVPVAEVDGTGAFMVDMELSADHKNFRFVVRKKQ